MRSWFTTADHKQLGRLYLLAALVFVVASAVVGILLRLGLDVGDDAYGRLYNLHATTGVVLVLVPAWLGLATYVVPLQIGAAGLAFDRLQSFAFWAFLFGGLVHLASYLGDGPALLGLAPSRFTAIAGDTGQTDMWILSLAAVTVASILAAANLLATILRLRTTGMTLGRLPMFSWGTLVAGAGWLLAAPVFLSGLLLLFLDLHVGGSEFFGPASFGTQVVWQHTLWLFGRPDIYLLAVPLLGAACDVIATMAGRPLANQKVARGALVAVGALGFGAWAAGTEVAEAVVLPAYTVATALVLIPIGLLVLVWLDTLRRGRPVFRPAAVFVVGAFLCVAAGGVAAIAAAIEPVEGGTVWSAGSAHVLAFGPLVLLTLAAVQHWSPKLWGNEVAPSAAAAAALITTGGVVLLGLGSYLGGWDGEQFASNASDGGFRWLTAAGGAVLALGVLAYVGAAAGVARRARTGPGIDDPYAGITLEWATTSPPPPHNFDTLPEVRSDQPLADLRAGSSA